MKKKQKVTFASLALLLLAVFIILNWTSIVIDYHKRRRISAYNKMMFNEPFSVEDHEFYTEQFLKHQNALVKLNYFIRKRIPLKNSKKCGLCVAVDISRVLLIEDYYLLQEDYISPNTIEAIAKPEKMLIIEEIIAEHNKKVTLNKKDVLNLPSSGK
jgi:hypothetical protein